MAKAGLTWLARFTGAEPDFTCGRCRFFRSWSGWDLEKQITQGVKGSCRRYAPRDNDQVWKSADDWCGEFEPREGR